MICNSLEMIKIDWNMLELQKIVCIKYNLCICWFDCVKHLLMQGHE
jgi:hypothetical protein